MYIQQVNLPGTQPLLKPQIMEFTATLQNYACPDAENKGHLVLSTKKDCKLLIDSTKSGQENLEYNQYRYPAKNHEMCQKDFKQGFITKANLSHLIKDTHYIG